MTVPRDIARGAAIAFGFAGLVTGATLGYFTGKAQSTPRDERSCLLRHAKEFAPMGTSGAQLLAEACADRGWDVESTKPQ